MKLWDSLKRSNRSLREAKIRTFLTASAIGIGAFALTMTLAASAGVQNFANNLINDNFNPSELVVAADPSVLAVNGGDSKPKLYDDSYTTNNTGGIVSQVKQLTDDDLSKLRQTKGVDQVRQAVSPAIQYASGPNSKRYIAAAYTFSPAQHPDLLAGKIPQPLAGNQLLLPAAFVSALGFKSNAAAIGRTIDLSVQKAFDLASLQSGLQKVSSGQSVGSVTAANSQLFRFTVAAVYKDPVTAQPGTQNIFYIGLDDAATLNDYATKDTPNYHKYTYAYVAVHDGTDAAKLTAVQNQLKHDGYSVQSVKDTQKQLNQIVNVLRGIVVAFGIIAIIASIFGIVNTMYISVLQRTREIGLMKALGMRRGEIGRLFRLEAAWIGFLGGVLGAAVAIGLGTLLNPVISKKLSLGNQHLLIFQPLPIAILVIILVVIAILAGLLPARKAARLNPIDALRTE